MKRQRLMMEASDVEADVNLTNIGLRQDSIGSIPRLQRSVVSRPLKKQQSIPIKVGDVVTFIYHSNRVHGVAKYIGETDFSANTLCGVSLSEGVGKHNGIVKGRKYFECPEKHGVFVPLRKVVLAPATLRNKIKKRFVGTGGEIEREEEENVEEEVIEEISSDSEMRITVRSYKASPIQDNTLVKPITTAALPKHNKEQLPISTSSDRSAISSNSSCDSGFESPTRFKQHPRRFKGKAKNIVVSSFIAESPQRPLLFNSFDEDSTPTERELEKSHDLNQCSDLKKTSVIDDLDPDVFESEVKPNLTSEHNKAVVDEDVCQERKFKDHRESPILSLDTEDGQSKIPRRMASPTISPLVKPSMVKPSVVNSSLVKSTVVKPTAHSAEKTTTSHSRVKPTTQSAVKPIGHSVVKPITNSVERTADQLEVKPTTHSVAKPRSHSGVNATAFSAHSSTKSTTPPPTVKPSLVKPTNPLNVRAKNTQIKRTTTVTANFSKLRQPSATSKLNSTSTSHKSSTETPAKNPIVIKSVSKSPSKVSTAPTIRKISSSYKADHSKKASKDDDSSVVMGNTNATIHPSAKPVDSKVSEVYSQREISGGAVVIERTKKMKIKPNQNGIIHHDTKNIKSGDLSKLKDLEQEIDNLNNQLKERKNRINELESSVQNNNNIIEEDKSEFSKLQNSFKNDLLLKDQSIQHQEEKLKVAKDLVDKSNKGLEALSLVINYYVSQVAQTTSSLNSSHSKNSKLTDAISKVTDEKNGLQSTVNELKVKLESESCRCETLQKEFDALRESHQVELSKINEEHVIELNKAVTQKQKEYDTKFQDVLNKQNEDAETHANEIKRLKEEHEEAKEVLNNEKEKEARLSAEPPRLTSPGGTPIYTDKYNNMPEELKSLNIVLDMKNEELKNLRSKTMELERKLESHHDLATKYDVLLQKNQSMSEMLKMKVHTERQLSFERESLLEKFENESKKVSRLSMEKEQLIWRASNPDLSYRSLTRCEEDDECDDDEERDSPPSPLRSGSFSANSTPRRPKGSNESEIAKKLKRRSMNF